VNGSQSFEEVKVNIVFLIFLLLSISKCIKIKTFVIGKIGLRLFILEIFYNWYNLFLFCEV